MNERQLRGIIRQVIRESHSPNTRLLVEDEGGGALYKAFVSPFVDVIKAGNLFTKDMLNIFSLAFNTFFSLDPATIRESREKYNARREKIAAEWKPLMDKAKASIEKSDVAILGMVMAPNLYFGVLGAKIAGSGVNTADEYLQALGIKQYVKDTNATLEKKLEGWLADQERESNRQERERGREGLGGRLRNFFFGEAEWHDGQILVEADEDPKKKDTDPGKKDAPTGPGLDINKLSQELFGNGGPLEDLFTESQEELIAAKEEQIESLVGTANVIINGLRGISQAKQLDEFEKSIQSLKDQLARRDSKQKIDLSPIEKAIQGLKDQMEKKYEEVIASEKSPAPEGADKKDIETVAKKASEDAFESAAGELRKMASDAADTATKNYKETIAEELASDIPKDGPLADGFKSSKGGQEIIGLIKKALDSIGTGSDNAAQ